ncbi:MAG TPA: hypothetical protein PKC72_12030 [Chitinophagaceae bacterium]|nr:hypothetical protein [Chitinophagaceae bacterium]
MKKLLFILSFILPLSLTSKLTSAQEGMAEAIQQMGETEIENIQNHWEHLENMGEIISDGIGHLNTALNIYDNVHDMYEASNALDNNECVPDFTTDAQSMMPSSCGEQSGCTECYQSNINNLTTIRRSLARMSCIRMNIKKFTDAAVAFGDNVSGIHAVTGLAWQAERRGILESVDKFNNTYDNKYRELITALQNALQGISRCEAQYGMRDWYQRFGFIYFEMMKEKYKRTD